MSIARFIDHTILKPDTRLADVATLCTEASQYQFASVCVPPFFVQTAAALLTNPAVQVATVIGFPFGYSHCTAKIAEINQAVEDGAAELDMVINIAALKNKDYTYLEDEIKAVTEALTEKNKVLKLILETGLLSDEEIIACCDLYQQYPVQFLKTSTGYAQKGASIEAVQLMRQHLPENIQIKASGGIRSFDFAQSLLQAGATRLGCSASVAIVKGQETEKGGY